MFTGLIREVGRVTDMQQRGREGFLSVACPSVVADAAHGDSIAVDGACLTIENVSKDGFSAFMSAETLDRTTLGDLRAGAKVNLEPALRLSDRLGGHLVQGHVEGVGVVERLSPVGDGWVLAVELPKGLEEGIIPKGSIALAGVSLTVSALSGRRLEVAVIPSTLEATTLRSWRPGTRVNVETDLVGRYILTYLKRRGTPGGVTMEQLIDKGF